MTNTNKRIWGLAATLALAALIVVLGYLSPEALSIPPAPVSNSALPVLNEQESAAGLARDVQKNLATLSAAEQKKLLSDPLFRAYFSSDGPFSRDPEARRVFYLSWLDGLKDNFCRKFLEDVASLSYDAEGVKKLNLPEAIASCPSATNASLASTIAYVNARLLAAFGDHYTQVLEPAKAQYLQGRISGNLTLARAGVGLQFTVDKSRTLPSAENAGPRFQFNGLVYHAASGGPAGSAGIEDGDRILRINGEEVIGQDFEHVLNDLLLGEKGTSVRLSVELNGQVFERTVLRAQVKPDAVWIRDLGDGIYALVVSEWRENVKSEVLSALYKLQSLSARGIILDWRLNGGGLFDEAIISSSYFVQNGTLINERLRIPSDSEASATQFKYSSISWQRRNGQLFRISRDEATGRVREQRMLVDLSAGDTKTDKNQSALGVDVPFFENLPPVAVLINGGSASATGIATGALKLNRSRDDGKNQGAIVIGEPSFGKGIEQKVGPAPLSTGISVTTGRYMLADGSWPGDAQKHRYPIQPDMFVEEPDDALYYTASDRQLMAAVEYLKKENWLPAAVQ